MTRDIIDINDFTVLVETAYSQTSTTEICTFDEPLIAVAFYGSGDVELTIKSEAKEKVLHHTQGLALSFFADDQVQFMHAVSAHRPLESILIATKMSSLHKLPSLEGELFGEMLQQLVHPKDHFVEGPSCYMTPEMQLILNQVLHSQYQGKAKMMFFRSHITALLAHFFGQLSLIPTKTISADERQRLELAREILTTHLEKPPSLTELSRQIGLNTFKLKKHFKELFGVPVFKYLQNERLQKAHDLLRNGDMSIQEAAWQVGYDSLSSFSNAFTRKFGFRPSEIKQ